MIEKQKISILMGAYNAEKTLVKAIDSILNQTYPHFEFIICDDASSDSTWEIIQAYALKDSRIIPLQNKKNQGLAATLNTCNKSATGIFLARQDADDFSTSNRFELQIAYLEKHPTIDVLSTDAFLCDETGHVWGEHRGPQIIAKSDWARGSQIIHACTMMKKSIFDKAEGYNSRAIRVEDYDLWMRILYLGGKIEILHEKLYTITWSGNDYKRKKRRDRFREIKYKIQGMLLNKMPIWSYIYIFKSLVLVFVPSNLLFKYHSKRMKNTSI